MFFNFFILFFSLAFCSLLLDWIDNERNQDGSMIMPFSPVMRPSQIIPNQSNNSKSSFMDAFMQHLKATERKNDTAAAPALFTPDRVEIRLPMEPKQQKEPKPPKERKPARKPREPSVKKPRRKKEESNCTTIGLQIQIRDPNTEPAPEPPQHNDFESNKITYAYQSDETDAIATSNLISNAAENYLPVSSVSELGAASQTYYNMDSTENEPGEQYLYEPEPVYHVQPMGVLPNECGDRSTPIIPSPDINAPPLNPYNLYSDQKANGHPILSHFNVSHTNVSKSSVNSLHNWRAGNEIM